MAGHNPNSALDDCPADLFVPAEPLPIPVPEGICGKPTNMILTPGGGQQYAREAEMSAKSSATNTLPIKNLHPCGAAADWREYDADTRQLRSVPDGRYICSECWKKHWIALHPGEWPYWEENITAGF
jgi:hypothetical protein